MSHKHAGDDYVYEDGHVDPVKCIEVGPTTCLLPITNSRGDDPAGFIFGHDREGFDVRCEGFVSVVENDGRPVWGMTGSLEGGDLTLTPSILCQLGNVANVPCGYHGFVTNGKWVPA
jgi:hypothetical protein